MGIMEDVMGRLGGLVPMPKRAVERAPMVDTKKSSARVMEMWAKDTARRKSREKQWQLNCSMVLGNQWCGWNGSSVQQLQAPSWRVQAVDNKLFVRVRSKQMRLLQDMTPVCIPDSPEHEDIRRAKYKERLLAHIRREVGDIRLRFRASQWLITCGEVYTEVYWNDSAGDTYAIDGAALSEGDVAIRIWDPFAVWPGAASSAGNNGGRLSTVDIVHVDMARLKYGIKDISPDANETTDVKLRLSMDTFFTANVSGSFTMSDDSQAGLEDCVQVRTLREYRTAALPMGRKSIIINNKVVHEEPLVWDGITHIINFPAYNSYHGDAVEVRNSIQPQKSINRLESNWEEYVRTMAKGKILTHKSNNIKASQFDSENMEIVKYEGSGPAPTPWMPPPMPSDTINLIQLKTELIDDLFADHMASQGKAPASASGSAINYLQEQDTLQHSMTLDEWRSGWARTWEKALDVVAGRPGTGTKGYGPERMIAMLGENRRADVQKVNVDLLGGKNRIHVTVGGALPDNKTLRAEIARRWFVDGVLGDPALKETRRKFLKMVDAGVDVDVYDDEFLDEIRAERENEQMAMGQMIAPRPEEGHATHSYTHGHYMKSDEFLQLPPEIQDIFYDHKELHDQQAILEASNPMLPSNVAASAAAPQAPQVGAGDQALPTSSPAVEGPEDMSKGVIQSAEPAPVPGI